MKIGLSTVIIALSCFLFNGELPGAEPATNITLRVLLYPWVPDYANIAGVFEQMFEAENPDVDLIISEQNWKYYEAGGLDSEYDIYELDGIFLHDFVAKGRIQPLDPSFAGRKDALKAASDGTTVGGSTYAVPHWVCALYLFYFSQDKALAGANTRDELARIIGANHERGRGLLADWKGRSTLSELYADFLLDSGLSMGETTTAIMSGKVQEQSHKALSELIGLCDAGVGRADVAHDAWPPYYALEFAHARGRTLVGYSERMYHILGEIENPSEPTPVVDPRTIAIKIYNQGSQSCTPLMWVDSFVVGKSVNGLKLDAARRFINFVVRDDVYRRALLPSNKPPQYILPAYTKVYSDAKLLSAAPLYPKFLDGLDGAKTLVGPGLPDALQQIGQLLDAKLPTNLYRK